MVAGYVTCAALMSVSADASVNEVLHESEVVVTYWESLGVLSTALAIFFLPLVSSSLSVNAVYGAPLVYLPAWEGL